MEIQIEAERSLAQETQNKEQVEYQYGYVRPWTDDEDDAPGAGWWSSPGCGGKFGRSLRHETWFAPDWALDVLASTMHENNDEREGPNRDSADIWIRPEGFISLHLWIDALENPDYDMMLVADLKKVDNYNCEEEESFALGDAIYIELMKAYGHWK